MEVKQQRNKQTKSDNELDELISILDSIPKEGWTKTLGSCPLTFSQLIVYSVQIMPGFQFYMKTRKFPYDTPKMISPILIKSGNEIVKHMYVTEKQKSLLDIMLTKLEKNDLTNN